jgi:hypothetical protein
MSHFKCPYCNHDQIVTSPQVSERLHHFSIENKRYGEVGFVSKAISCANPKCQEISLNADFVSVEFYAGNWRAGASLQTFQLRPGSRAKPQPECVPPALTNDYYEACAIEALSPKAAATLARRCIQGMIRDFCNISEKTLFAEITKLKQQVEAGAAAQGVTEDTIAAIDAVRSIGNIGAHMEADINVIVDIEPGEAQALIELIELLFQDWYVARNARRQRLAKVQAIAAEKKRLLEPPPNQLAAPTEISLALLGQSTKSAD